MADFSSDNLSSMVEKVTAGATGAMGNITGMSSFDATYLAGMIEKVTAGATGALGNITMANYDATDLSGMMEKVTAGATGALGNITMADFSSDNLSSMVEKVTAGATGAMGNITGMSSFDATYLTGMIEKVTAGATGALGNITMANFNKDDLSVMIEKATAGATGAVGKISMEGYSNDNATAMMEKVNAGATDGLANLTFTGSDGVAYDRNSDNYSSSVTSGASSGTLVFLGSDNVSGTYSTGWGSAKPSDGCISNGTALGMLTSLMPSGTAGFKIQKIFTSSTSFTKKYSFYSDSSCSTSTGYIKYGYINIIVSPVAVGVTAGTAPERAGSAYQVKYEKLNMITKGNTSLAVTFLNTLALGITHTSGVEQTNPNCCGIIYDIWATEVSGGYTLLYSKWDPSTTTYPPNWSSQDDISFK
jgi:hypothetical protein